jgi:2-dehydro-3-deoxyphosphogluconate aldolase/(4S)-4-hydroxy-2-oxoglutarate aldolase
MENFFLKRLVPVTVIDKPEDAVAIAKALMAGGLNVIEITFRTPNAAACIDAIRRAVPSMVVGAGTLLDAAQVQSAVGAGAHFGVSPGINPKTVTKAMELGLFFIPGVMTASEIERGIELGCSLLKFFPAEAAGGIKMLRAISGPFAHTGVKFMPSGGISPSTMLEYLAFPPVAAIGGTWLTDSTIVSAKNWAKTTELTSQAMATIAKVA